MHQRRHQHEHRQAQHPKKRASASQLQHHKRAVNSLVKWPPGAAFCARTIKKRLKKEIGGCKVNKGDAAYLWSARFSLAHRPPHQHSWSGNNQLCLSSLQQQNTRFAIKRTTSKLEEQTNIFNSRPATEARASVCFRQPHVLFKKSAALSCAVRGDENEGWRNERQKEANHFTL